MRRLDVAIAGAGPAGLAMALALHREGHRVVLYEQFDEPRPLGSGLILQPTGLAVLDWLGLGDKLRSLGARIDRLFGTSSESGRTVLDVRYAALGEARGYAVHRAALFGTLFEAVLQAGIAIEKKSRINGLEGGVLTLSQGRASPAFDLVIDASGASSPLASSTHGGRTTRPLRYGAVWSSLPWPEAGFDPHALEQKYNRASVMIGVLPIGRVTLQGPQQAAFFWSLKHDVYAQWRAAGIKAWKHEVLRHWPQVAPLLEHVGSPDDLVLARYQHHTLAIPYGDRLICIGDAAHATSPQLGQGANMALLDVRALSEALRLNDDLAAAAAAYARARKWHVQVYQALSAAFTPFYQSDSILLPFLRDSLVAPLSKIPPVQRLLAHTVAGTVVRPSRAPLSVRSGA